LLSPPPPSERVEVEREPESERRPEAEEDTEWEDADTQNT